MLNLLTPVTRELKRLDGVLRQDHLLNFAIKEAKTPNKITKAEKEYLRRYNISVEDSKKLSEMPIERGESGLIYANTDEWPDEALKTTFQRSMSSGILNTIMQATPSDRPIMAEQNNSCLRHRANEISNLGYTLDDGARIYGS